MGLITAGVGSGARFPWSIILAIPAVNPTVAATIAAEIAQ